MCQAQPWPLSKRAIPRSSHSLTLSPNLSWRWLDPGGAFHLAVALAVKVKSGGQKTRAGLSPGSRPGSGPRHPRFLACDGQPLLIAAWLVGFMRTRKPRKGQAMKMDIYQRITDQIVGELEKGVRPWLRPWNAELPLGVSRGPCAGAEFRIGVSMS